MTKHEFFDQAFPWYRCYGMQNLDVEHWQANDGTPMMRAWGNGRDGNPERVDEPFTFDEFIGAMEKRMARITVLS